MAARPMLKQFARHIRLYSSTLIAVVLFFVLPHDWDWLLRLLISWNVGVLLFLVLAYRLMFRLDAKQLVKKYEEEDEAAGVILIISIIGAILTMASIVAFLSGLDDVGTSEKCVHIPLAALTVIDTWALIPTMFTL